MSPNANLSAFFRGDTRVYPVSFKDKTGTPIDISGHELWFTLKRDPKDEDKDAVFQKMVVFPSDENSRNGAGEMRLESNETDTIPPLTYFYDLQKVIPGDPPDVATLAFGKVSVMADITRRTKA